MSRAYYYMDTAKNFIFIVDRSETVIISIFSGALKEIVQPIGDPMRLTILCLVIFLLWNRLQSLLRLAVTKLWKEKGPEDDNEITMLQRRERQRKELFKIYYGNNSWHNVFGRILDYISMLSFYLVIEFFTTTIFTVWKDKEFGVFDSAAAILIVLIGLVTILQILTEISAIESEVDAVQKGLDLRALRLNDQNRLTDY